jgi:ABC-type transport system involved in multi-copper enzyme maturation, permease component
MSTTTVPNEAIIKEEPRPPSELRVPHAGWRVIAAKELGDHLLSIRFIVLLIVLGLAAVIPLYFAADLIRSAAPQASGSPAVFLALFTLGSQDYTFLRVDSFVAIVAPLLGLAFAFDAINGERSEGTLPRLLAQPIYRDDVINGKFAAGLAVIGVVLVAIVGIIAGYGIFRLGIVPASEEIVRLGAWILVTFVYVGLWLAFGLLLSVLFRRAATSALIGFGVWFLFTTFGPLITNLIGTALSPLTGSTTVERIGQAQTQQFISRLLPGQLYSEVTAVLLNPSRNPQVDLPGSLGQAQQAAQQIPTLLAFDQSLLLVWPQVVALVAMTVVCFGAAYVAFMRQEVRA